MTKIRFFILPLFWVLLCNLLAAQSVKISAKVFLSNANPSTLMMDNYLTTLSSFPLSDPYATAPLNTNFTHVNNSTVATINASALSNTGTNAIVDWVFVELRQSVMGTSTVISTKAGILKTNGIIVDTDIISPLQFSNTPSGNYFITIRHRNHIGFRTANTVALSSVPTVLDFTNNSISLFGSTPLLPLTSTVSVMNGGDANSDGSIDGTDTGAWELQNGSYDNYFLSADYNLDGSIDGVDAGIWEINNGKYQEY